MFCFIIGIISTIDQIIKALIEKKVKYNTTIEIFKDKFYITNIRNTGAMNGFLKNKRNLLMILSSFSFIYLFYLFLAYKAKSIRIALSFVIGGALGNLIDRIKKKYVVDYLYIKYKKLPVFNFADLCIIIGVIATGINMILHKEN